MHTERLTKQHAPAELSQRPLPPRQPGTDEAPREANTSATAVATTLPFKAPAWAVLALVTAFCAYNE